MAAYRKLRGLLHTGALTHPEGGDEGLRITAVTAADSSHSAVRVARVASSGRALPRLLQVGGLEGEALHVVRPVAGLELPGSIEPTAPAGLDAGQVHLTGAALAHHHGLRLPLLGPGQAIVLEIEMVHPSESAAEH